MRDIEKIIELYQSGKTMKEIASIYQVHKQTIGRDLKKNGIEVRNRSDARRVHTMNHSAFSEQSEERDYWAGFLFADGWIYEHRANGSDVLGVKLAQKDAEHVHKFRNFLKTSVPARYGESRHKDTKNVAKYATLTVSSQEMCNDLRRLGMSGLSSQPNEELITSRHFWRGVFDGDGGITTTKPRDKRYIVALFVGGLPIVTAYHQQASKIAPVYSGNILKHGSIYKVSMAGKSAKTWLEYLYNDSTIYLDRKYERFRREDA